MGYRCLYSLRQPVFPPLMSGLCGVLQGDTEGSFFLSFLLLPPLASPATPLHSKLAPTTTPLLLLLPHFSPPHHLQTLRSNAPPLTSLSSTSRPLSYHLSALAPLNTSFPLSLLSLPLGPAAGAPPLPSTFTTPCHTLTPHPCFPVSQSHVLLATPVCHIPHQSPTNYPFFYFLSCPISQPSFPYLLHSLFHSFSSQHLQDPRHSQTVPKIKWGRLCVEREVGSPVSFLLISRHGASLYPAVCKNNHAPRTNELKVIYASFSAPWTLFRQRGKRR